MRPLHWLPTVLLEWCCARPALRHLWSEAWIELHARAADVAVDESNDESGPWLVQPPRGMH